MKLKLYSKFIISISLVLILINTVGYFYIKKSLRQYHYQQLSSNMLREINLARTFVDNSIKLKSDSVDLDSIADEAGASLGRRITIINDEGLVLGDSNINKDKLKNLENYINRPEFLDAIKNEYGVSVRFSNLAKEDMYFIAHTLTINDQKCYIRLAASISSLDSYSSFNEKIINFLLVSAFSLTVIICVIIYKLVTKPMHEIMLAAKEITDGNYKRQAKVVSNDEIGDLANFINKASKSFSRKIEDFTYSKSQFEAIFHSMSEGTIVVDKTGNILLMNLELRKLFNIKDNPIDKKLLEVIRNTEIQEMSDSVISSNIFDSKEITIIIPNEKILLVSAAPIMRHEKMDGCVMVFHDITELRRLENIRKDFVANVSHELRTPLTSIKGYTETLLDGAINDKANASDFLKIISDDANHLVEMVDDLLEISRLESDNLTLESSSIDIEPVIETVFKSLKKEAANRNISLRKTVPTNLPKIKIDEVSIYQVLLNLITNALKYNIEGGSISISAIEEGNDIQINVTDTGIGIPKNDISRIFERFYRVDKGRTKNPGSTGLGLSIVKHIILANKGGISVQSELGKGTTFTFILPKA